MLCVPDKNSLHVTRKRDGVCICIFMSSFLSRISVFTSVFFLTCTDDDRRIALLLVERSDKVQ